MTSLCSSFGEHFFPSILVDDNSSLSIGILRLSGWMKVQMSKDQWKAVTFGRSQKVEIYEESDDSEVH